MSVRTQTADGVLTVTIDRPEQRNALNADVNRGLLEALAVAEGDDEVAVVVLTGAGDRAFCAGADLGGLNPDAGAAELHRARSLFADVLQRLRHLPKPVIARVNGAALAGGFGLALACDLAVAADHATFGTTEVKVGMWPYLISAVITEHLGPKRTMDLLLTGRRMGADEALSWGLVNRVVPAADLDGAVAEVTDGLRALSPVVLGLGKESYAVASQLSRDQALPYLAGMLSLHLQTSDAAEGITAFLQKRPPQWRGR
ncbi:MAG TPA: enoyl-CoA hydratase-related protein [Egibacteraceae bacterium]|nr:enoyl-CoA hydratase-related protein [Egibacteraceae bacterium]